MTCIACQRLIRYRGRLCVTCRADPLLREQHTHKKFTAHKHGDVYLPNPPKPEPTAAFAGSPEKVEVLRQRVEKLEDLWHADDAKWIMEHDENPTGE